MNSNTTLIRAACLLCVAFFSAAMTRAQQSFAAIGGAPTIEEEVIRDMLAQPIGAGTFADFAYPRSYLQRIADRVIRDSFERHFRIVVAEPGATPPPGPGSQPTRKTSIQWLAPDLDSDLQAGRIDDGTPPMPGVSIVRAIPSAIDDSSRISRVEQRPPLRGWRPRDDWPLMPPGKTEKPAEAAAAELVSRCLATDGLLLTVAQAILVLDGLERFSSCATAELQELQSIGVPTDLLRFFADKVNDEIAPIAGDDARVVRWVAQRLATSDDWFEFVAAMRSREFHFVSSEVTIERHANAGIDPAPHPSTRVRFQAADESGRSALAAVRLQLTRGADWLGVGDGGAVDVARQLAAQLPDTPLQLAIESSHVADLLATMSGWPSPASGRRVIQISPTDLNLAQWAHDVCKTGHRVASDGKRLGPAAIIPRYATRGEAGSMYVPGDTLASATIMHPAPLTALFQSPLLFQGGDIMISTMPGSGRRTMFVGEGQVYRNVALGLSHSEVLTAFLAEFGVDECLVLPAISFHADFEMSIRCIGDERIAFVNDSVAARDIILRAGVRKLAELAVLSPAQAGGATAHLQAGRWREFMNLVAAPLMARATAFGQYPESLASAFSTGPSDSGVGNFQRFLLAIDLYVAANTPESEVPADRPHGYIRAIRRRDADRRELHRELSAIGMRVVPVPSLSDDLRGINYLNGIHTPTHYYMPAWGGFYQELDDAAAAAFRKTLGEKVTVTPIGCAESQRRGGALRCALAPIPEN